jgi:hypothetical protein
VYHAWVIHVLFFRDWEQKAPTQFQTTEELSISRLRITAKFDSGRNKTAFIPYG